MNKYECTNIVFADSDALNRPEWPGLSSNAHQLRLVGILMLENENILNFVYSFERQNYFSLKFACLMNLTN